MKKSTTIWIILSACFTLAMLFSSCDPEETKKKDEFDRKVMLEYWADNYIIPGYEAYSNSLNDLESKLAAFKQDSDNTQYAALCEAWLDSYSLWQRVSMFDIGLAESKGLRNFTNIYPCNTHKIDAYINGENYNFNLPSNYANQGFPAMDYLLYGHGDTAESNIEFLKEDKTIVYFEVLVKRLQKLTSEVLNDWKNTFRADFINNYGSSGTASVDKMANDFIFYYEKFLRTAKIGIPAGVFSGDPLPKNVEAYYSKTNNKKLFNIGFQAAKDFYAGKSFDGQKTGPSLQSYLAYIRQLNDSKDINGELLMRWERAQEKVNLLDDNFAKEITNDLTKVLTAYDAVNKAVSVLKVDMMQALNIQVDYIDADGD